MKSTYPISKTVFIITVCVCVYSYTEKSHKRKQSSRYTMLTVCTLGTSHSYLVRSKLQIYNLNILINALLLNAKEHNTHHIFFTKTKQTETDLSTVIQ